MADFETAVRKTLIHEGGFVNNPADPGGATKYGITQRDLPGTNIAEITEDDAVKYYTEHYWKPLYSQIESQEVADKLFDMGVLFGVKEAVKMLQLAIARQFNLTPDGEFGAETLNAINQADPETMLNTYKTLLVSYTIRIVTNKPEERIFLSGWGNRINS